MKIDVIIQYAIHYPIISALGSKDVYVEVFNLCGQLRFDLDRKYDINNLQFKFAWKSMPVLENYNIELHGALRPSF